MSLGTLELIEAARRAGVARFVFISTCAVHEKILNDRPLDETHPTWATSHYGAHKAAIEQFVYSYGLGEGYPICALRPTGIYGLARPVQDSRWFDLVQAVTRGEPVDVHGGGKEVHASDVAHAVEILLTSGAELVYAVPDHLNDFRQTLSCFGPQVLEVRGGVGPLVLPLLHRAFNQIDNRRQRRPRCVGPI